MTFSFRTKSYSHMLLSENETPENNLAAFEILEYCKKNKIDFISKTFSPSKAEIVSFLKIFERRILYCLTMREDNPDVKAFIKDRFPVKEMEWKNNKYKLVLPIDKDLIKWIKYYNAFQNSLIENSSIYIDYIEESQIIELQNDLVSKIDSLLIKEKEIKIESIFEILSIRKSILMKYLKLLIKWGVVEEEGNIVKLTNRGRRLKDSNYTQIF